VRKARANHLLNDSGPDRKWQLRMLFLKPSLRQYRSFRFEFLEFYGKKNQYSYCLIFSAQEKLLEELNQWHTDAREFAESSYKAVEKTGSQLKDSVCFSERLMQCGSAQILPMRQIVLRRLQSLSAALPYLLSATKCRNGIEFETDRSKFYAVVQAGFGHFANADDSSGTTCCKKIDDAFSLGGDLYLKRDIDSGGLMSLSKVSDFKDKFRF